MCKQILLGDIVSPLDIVSIVHIRISSSVYGGSTVAGSVAASIVADRVAMARANGYY